MSPQRFDFDARLTIALIESRGIWVELDGALTAGRCERVAPRFDQLARLAFAVFVIDTGGLTAIDAVGIQLVEDFVDALRRHGGAALAIGPTEVWRPVADLELEGLVTKFDTTPKSADPRLDALLADPHLIALQQQRNGFDLHR